MPSSTENLVLAPDAPVDFQLHTTYSDGRWQPADLIGHLAAQGFGLAAFTDHERVDTIDAVQKLAIEKDMPMLTACEMTTHWKEQLTDVLIFGFRSGDTPLVGLCKDVLRRQRDNTRQVYAGLRQKGIPLPDGTAELDAILRMASAWQPFALVEMMLRYGYKTEEKNLWTIAKSVGCRSATTDIGEVLDAAHASGAVCLIAHPGRGGDNMVYTPDELDELRRVVPIDGFEAYYPLHTPEQTQMFLDYARKHHLLVSAGSDSHSIEKPPIKYPAENVRAFLERMGITVEQPLAQDR